MATEQLSLFETEVKKRCTKCGELKGLDEFSKMKLGKYGRRFQCKACDKEYMDANRARRRDYQKWYYLENRDRLIMESRKWAVANKEKVADKNHKYYMEHEDELREYNKDYYKNNRAYALKYAKEYRENNQDKVAALRSAYKITHWDEIKARQKKRYDEVISKDPKHILRTRVANKMRRSLLDGKNGRSWESFVDYNATDLVKHLKKSMPKGYTWEDFKRNPSFFHIDHIIPIDVFNFDAPDQIDFKKCWSLKNLQLLPARENIIKRNRIDAPFQPSLNMSFGQV